MRVNLGNETYPQSGRSYLDSADDIIALPARELQRISRAGDRAGGAEDSPLDGLHELDLIYGLATQI